MDIYSGSGDVSSWTLQSKQAKEHVFCIRTEGDIPVLSSVHITSTWHFQLYCNYPAKYSARQVQVMYLAKPSL